MVHVNASWLILLGSRIPSSPSKKQVPSEPSHSTDFESSAHVFSTIYFLLLLFFFLKKNFLLLFFFKKKPFFFDFFIVYFFFC